MIFSEKRKKSKKSQKSVCANEKVFTFAHLKNGTGTEDEREGLRGKKEYIEKIVISQE